MNFVLRVMFEDGDQFTYTKVPGALPCDAQLRRALPGAAQHAAACVQVKASIGNIIVGKPTVNHFGTFRIENKGTGLAAVMELVKPPLLALSSKSRKLHEVRQGWRPRMRARAQLFRRCLCLLVLTGSLGLGTR